MTEQEALDALAAEGQLMDQIQALTVERDAAIASCAWLRDECLKAIAEGLCADGPAAITVLTAALYSDKKGLLLLEQIARSEDVIKAARDARMLDERYESGRKLGREEGRKAAIEECAKLCEKYFEESGETLAAEIRKLVKP